MPEQLHVEPETGVMFAPTTIADFTIVSELGRGGMGLVYEAYDPCLDRHVAIKIVRDRRAGSAAGLRLSSEAKAMARLTHPNVVAVHQVGTIDNQVYVVMELVRGDTLADWLARPDRSWREIVAMFLQAGEGLLAAHRAGLIHRDFKPANVLVDQEGRARVGDFGLARSEEATPRFAVGSENSGIAGTPAYMAPEQQQADVQIDARVDQFAYAVSLERALVTAQGKPSRRVTAALSRARSLDRADRFPDLSELLVELRAGSRSRRRLLAIAGGGAAIGGVVVAALLLSASSSSHSCEDDSDLADRVWNPTARAAHVASFLRARPDSAVASASTVSIVEAWVDRWKLGRRDTCALDDSGRQARIECLDDQLQQLSSQVELWSHADSSAVDGAVRAATMLPQPSACTTTVAAIDPALRTKITMLDAQRRSGHAREAHDGIADMLSLAEKSTPRTLATALLVAGRIERENGNATGASGLLSRAVREAGRASDDVLLFEALLDQATVSVDLGHPREALGLLDAAAALQSRGGEDAGERVALHRADALGQAGLAEEAIAESMRVLPLLEARALRDPAARIQLSTALGQLAAAQLPVEREAARLTLVRLLELDEKLFGADHPEVAKTLHDLGAAELQLERKDEAAQHLQRALRIASRSYGERHPMVSTIYVTSAHLALVQQRGADAKRLYGSARDALKGVMPDDAPQFIAIEQGLGDIARAEDNCKEALPHFTRAVQLLKKTGQRENDHAMQLTNLGFCLQDTGRLADARETLQLSIAEIDRLQMARKWKSEPLAILADMEFAAGKVAAAIELEKAALTALEGAEGSDVEAMREYEQTQLATWTKRK